MYLQLPSVSLSLFLSDFLCNPFQFSLPCTQPKSVKRCRRRGGRTRTWTDHANRSNGHARTCTGERILTLPVFPLYTSLSRRQKRSCKSPLFLPSFLSFLLHQFQLGCRLFISASSGFVTSSTHSPDCTGSPCLHESTRPLLALK